MKSLVCLLALLSAVPAGAEPLGRLFFDPARRTELDKARQQERAVETPATAARITLNGVVTRSDGDGTVWINNQAHTGKGTPPGVTVGANGQIGVKSPASGRTVPLMVGQSLDLGSGLIEEGYRRVSPSRQKAPGGQ